ncbi:MAG: hypothetical protein JW742_04055 [Candidatus Aminicenantes bacterium]|nr:hypothetical protein [Candidatus Aminicenantes bacterium]
MIRSRAKKVAPRGAGLPLAVVLLIAAGRPAAAPPWWDLEVRLSVDGGYRVAGDGFEADGCYRWTVSWVGMMEKDDADVRLFHTRCDVVRWEAEEKVSRPDGVVRLATSDFPDTPALSLNFVLRRGDRLVFDLAARGFAVPVASSPAKLMLLFPSSAENGQFVDGVDYNGRILKGSNRVVLPFEDLLTGPVKKTFAWDWKSEDGPPGQTRTVAAAQRHRAALTVTVRPRHEARPEPGAPRAQALGW